jgi:hypothetical protein
MSQEKSDGPYGTQSEGKPRACLTNQLLPLFDPDSDLMAICLNLNSRQAISDPAVGRELLSHGFALLDKAC